jgi:hypothetical protein
MRYAARGQALVQSRMTDTWVEKPIAWLDDNCFLATSNLNFDCTATVTTTCNQHVQTTEPERWTEAARHFIVTGLAVTCTMVGSVMEEMFHAHLNGACLSSQVYGIHRDITDCLEYNDR